MCSASWWVSCSFTWELRQLRCIHSQTCHIYIFKVQVSSLFCLVECDCDLSHHLWEREIIATWWNQHHLVSTEYWNHTCVHSELQQPQVFIARAELIESVSLSWAPSCENALLKQQSRSSAMLCILVHFGMSCHSAAWLKVLEPLLAETETGNCHAEIRPGSLSQNLKLPWCRKTRTAPSSCMSNLWNVKESPSAALIQVT